MKTREQILLKRLTRWNSVLDLGNSWGDFKDLIKDKCGFYRGLDLEDGSDYCYDLNEEIVLGRYFDIIIAGELIEHLSNIDVFLTNVKNYLEKDGEFFLTTPNTTSFRFFFYALFFNKEPGYFKGHIHYYTKDSLKLLLESRGFEIIELGYCNLTTNIENKNWLFWIKFRIENMIGNIIPRFSPNIYCFARKKK